MNNLKNEISETYHTEKIDIKILNSKTLNISITDSRFNDYSSEKKQKLANQIGDMANDLRKNMSQIKAGELIFIDQTNYLLAKKEKSESFDMFK